MHKILFVCHGNICRSPMAEFVMKDLVEKRGLSDLFEIASAATSSEEIGNEVHYGTRERLAKEGIRCVGKQARQITEADYDNYDYLIGMDRYNISNMHRIFEQDGKRKIYMLLEFTGRHADIADPWYTNDFDATYDDILEGCTALLDFILSGKDICDVCIQY